MHHRGCDLDTSGPAVHDQAPCLALEVLQQGLGCGQVALIHVQCHGELTFEVLQDILDRPNVTATDQ